MIQLLIVASDPSILPVFNLVVASPQIQIAGAWIEDGALRAEIRKLFPDVKLLDRWDQIIEQANNERSLCIAGVIDDIITAAKQFLHVSKAPVFVITEQRGPVSELFRLMAIWQEAPQQIVPLFTSGVFGAIQLALQSFSDPVQRIEFHRTLRKENSTTITLHEMDHALLQDLEWITRFGEYSHVTTLLTAQQAQAAVEANVTLKGDPEKGNHVPELRWILTRQGELPHWKLRIFGESNTLTLACENQHEPFLQVNDHTETFPIGNTVQEDLFSAMQAALGAEMAAQQTWMNVAIRRSSWMEVVRNGEIGAAARRSLDRKRTIPIHFEEASERSQFKSQMTAIGCGVLLWVMFGIIAVLTLASIIDPRDREYRNSASAGFIIPQQEFETSGSALNTDGQARLQWIIERWSETSPVLLIESTASELDQLRENNVEKILLEQDLRDVNSKCVVRPLTGKWFERALWLAWAIVFLPLVAVLLAQFLLVVARPNS